MKKGRIEATSYFEFATIAEPSAPGAGIRLYSPANNQLAWTGVDGFARVFAGTPTSDRTYTLPNNSGTVALLSDLSVGTVGDGDKGDVTVSGSGATWLVDAISRQVVFSGETITTDTGTLNDYDPAGLANTYYLSWEGTAAATITGIAGGTTGRILKVSNNSASSVLVLAVDNANSIAANRFDFSINGRQSHVILFPNESLELRYRGARWTKGDASYRLSPNLASPRVLWAMPGTGTGLHNIGMATTSMGGTVSTPAISAGFRGGLHRTTGSTGGTAGTSAGIRATQNLCWRGNAAGLGGFHFRIPFFFSVIPATLSFFCGLRSSAALGNVESNTVVNSVGLFALVGDTQLGIGSNDGSGTATTTLLGADFPIDDTAVYELHLFALPNSSAIEYVVFRLDDLSILPAMGTLTTNLPTNTSFLSPIIWINNRTTAATGSVSWTDIELRLPL